MERENVETKEESKRIGCKRVVLARQNQAASACGGPAEHPKNLDMSLKKNTAYIKRLKTSLHLADSVGVLMKEAPILGLEKWLSELVSAAQEGLGRCKTASEVAGAVEVISALHQRFPESFTTPFATSLLSALAVPPKASLATLSAEQKEKDESARIARQRGLLRCLAELDVVSVVRRKESAKSVQTEAGEVTFGVLKDLLTADKEALASPLPLALAFAKHLGPLYLPSSTELPTLAEDDDRPQIDEQLVKPQLKEKFKKLICAYFEALGRKAVRDQLKLQDSERRNTEAYIRSGTIFEDRAAAFEKMTKDQDKLWTGVQSLGEALGLSPPVLPSGSTAAASSGAVTSLGPSSSFSTPETQYGRGSLWVDEEDRRFYRELADLRDEVPAVLLGPISMASAHNQPEEPVSLEEGENIPTPDHENQEEKREKLETRSIGNSTPRSGKAAANEDGPAIEGRSGEGQEEALPAAPAAQLTALFARLPDANGRDAIDKAAVEFAFLNSKAARKRVVKFLGGVSRQRLDLIPYYARMAATLNRYMPDVGAGLVAHLEEEFRWLQKKRTADMVETRAKNAQFLGELTKFSVTPPHSILHCIKVCVDDLSGPNIDILCHFLETCGRYLLRSEPTQEKMKQLLDQLKRKKSAQNLDQRAVMMLENAYYQCDPPDRPIIPPKERSPMELFVRHTLYNSLNRKSVEKVVKILRKLHWEDPEVVRLLKNIFTKPWKIKYSSVYLFAIVLHDLSRYHPGFTVSVIDQILEDIKAGMENNAFKYNQQRIAGVRFLGELYNFRLVDSKVIFDALWSFVTFGHPDGRPWPEAPSPIDLPDDFFRVRLICTLLTTCGACFDHGGLVKRLDNFLTFFVMYLRCKDPPPMDIDFLLQDTFEELRPQLNIYLGYDLAAKAVEEMFDAAGPDELLSDREVDEPDNDQRTAEEDGLEDGMDRTALGDEGEVVELDLDEGTDEDSENSESDSDGGKNSDEDEDEVPRNAMPPEEEDMFARELAKLMADSGSSGAVPSAGGISSELGQGNKKTARFELPSIAVRKTPAPVSDEICDSSTDMTFTLLTKKGNKQQTRVMTIPSDAPLAMHSRTQQDRARAEQRELKRLVLSYEAREAEEERKAFAGDAARRGWNIKFQGPG